MKGLLTISLLALCLSASAQCFLCDSIATRACELRLDSILKINGELRTKLFLAEYKVEKVRYYVAIVDRKPIQKRFLKGWVKRAIE